MRIVFITSKLNFNSAGGSVEEIDVMGKVLMKLGNEVTFVTAFSRSNDIPTNPPYQVIEENVTAKRLLSINRAGYALFKKYETEADFFHIEGHMFMYGAGMYRLLGGKVPVAAIFNAPFICWPETAPVKIISQPGGMLRKIKRKIRWYIEKYIGMPIANFIDLFLFVSPNSRIAFEEFGIRHSSADMVLGDPTDFNKIMQANNITEDSYIKRNKKNGEYPIKIFYSSRMIQGKGFDILLAGFAKVKNKEQFRLILGGTGPQEKQIKQMVHDLGLEPYVDTPGWVPKEQLMNYFKNADIFIQVGWKPYGTSITQLYAMAFGIPSILPGGGGLEWQAGASALYVTNGNDDELARAIEKLGTDANLRAELSKNCYKRIADDELNAELNITRAYERMLAINQDLQISRGRK